MKTSFQQSKVVASEFYHLCFKLVERTVKGDIKIVFVGTCGIVFYWSVQKIMKNWKKQRDITRLRDTKIAERDKNFLETRSHLQGSPNQYAPIISMPFKELRFKLQSRKIKARDVLEAFIFKCLESTEHLNSISSFIPEALETAEKLDNLVSVQGPLHGVPFCVNDDIDIQGLLPSFSCSINVPATTQSTETAVIVKILESQGAIPFCRTNSSIICMSYSARNPYFGEIGNPLNKRLSVGGSSGGTACLVATGCVPFGIATDRAGGARIPASFTGVTTLKPSRHRISRRGCSQHCVGTTTVPCIMTKQVSDLITLSGLVMEKTHHKFDPKVVPLPWNRQVCSSKQKLRIGYFASFPVSPVVGDVEEAVDKAKMYLQSCGHIVVKCKPPDDLKCQELWNGLIKVQSHRHGLQNEGSSGCGKSDGNSTSPRIIWQEETRRVKNASSDTTIWKKIVEKLDNLPGVKSSKDRAIERLHTTMNSDGDPWNTASLREQFVDEVLSSMNELNVDVVLCPVFGVPPSSPEVITKLGLLPGFYTYIWNLLDLPAGTVRVWKESGKYLGEELLDSVSSPIGVQVVGRPYSEELVLRVLNELDELNQS